jgi:hypothetical protein
LESNNTSITPDDLNSKLSEINTKLDLLTLGQELIYEDIMDKLENSQSIQIKDLKLILMSTLFSRGLDALKIWNIIDNLK